MENNNVMDQIRDQLRKAIAFAIKQGMEACASSEEGDIHMFAHNGIEVTEQNEDGTYATGFFSKSSFQQALQAFNCIAEKVPEAFRKIATYSTEVVNDLQAVVPEEFRNNKTLQSCFQTINKLPGVTSEMISTAFEQVCNDLGGEYRKYIEKDGSAMNNCNPSWSQGNGPYIAGIVGIIGISLMAYCCKRKQCNAAVSKICSAISSCCSKAKGYISFKEEEGVQVGYIGSEEEHKQDDLEMQQFEIKPKQTSTATQTDQEQQQ